ncbi:unnamed protein product [Rhodiola kirilowii]
MALSGKMKLAFVQGKIPRPDDAHQLARWMKCNSVIHSWLINSVSKEIASSLVHSVDSIQAWEDLHMQFGSSNVLTLANVHKEIANLTQGDMSVASYFGKLRKLWGEKESLDEEELCTLGTACKSTQTLMKRKERNKIIKFLMGLNDVYIPVRILAMRPMPKIIEVYGHVITEESQRGLTKSPAPEISAMFSANTQSGESQNARTSGTSQQGRSATLGGNRNKRPNCTFCHMQGHTRETCYKVHGYPPGHRMNKESQQKTGIIMANNTTSNVTDAGTSADKNTQLDVIQEQLKQLFSMMNKSDGKSGSSANHTYIAGITCLSTKLFSKDVWIVDSGASDHIASQFEILQNVRCLKPALEVIMPNGGTSTVTHIGTCQLNASIMLMDVLYVPEFRFNLLSVGKLAKDSGLHVSFTNTECCIQDHTKKKVLVTGTLTDGLYQVQMSSVKALHVCKESSLLWHYRLGHYPFKAMNDHLKFLFSDNSMQCTKNMCDICPLAKQTRLQFPNSTSTTSAIFELIHSDIWGPFATPSVTGAKYFLTIVDDYSRSTWTFMMQTKAEAADHLINFFHMVHTQFSRKVKILKTDNGSEFFSKKVIDFLASHGCLHQASCPYTPEQNGTVERKHRHLLEVARALKFKAGIPDCYWADCVLTATYLINRMPS